MKKKKVVATLQGYGGEVTKESLAELQKLFLPSDSYDDCEGTLCFMEGEVEKATMLVLPDIYDEYGIYLKCTDEVDEDGVRVWWLSLHDPTRLHEVTEACHEWYASIGLFLPPERAWLGVKEFCLTGRRSKLIKWIRHSDLPEGGNS